MKETEPQKQCSKCLKVLPIGSFYADSRGWGKFGCLSKCKACVAEYATRNREQIARRKREWEVANRERITEQRHAWRAIPEVKDRIRASNDRAKERHPEKVRARKMVSNAIRDGKLTRLPCQFCGDPQSEAHHEDYARPLEVTWACMKCHREILHGVRSQYED